jgi:maltoporin
LIAATALAAFSASALDFHGYFRDSEAFNSKGGSQVCFQLPGSDFKARLGNECDRYLEFSFAEGGKAASNIEWKAEFMPASYLPSVDGTASADLFVQQMWLGLKFNDWSGATLWAGRRYFKRHDVHSLDFFYWNPAQGNAGVGVEDVNLGGVAKLAVSSFRIDAIPGRTVGTGATATTVKDLTKGTYLVPELRVYDIAVNRDGTLEAGVDFGIANDQAVAAIGTETPALAHALGDKRAGTSMLYTVQHNQAKLLGGSNTLAFQYGTGAFAKEVGDGPGQLIAGGTSDDKQWRVIEHLVVNPTPELSGALVLIYQDKSTAGTVSNGSKTFSAELRPAYQFNDWFKFAVDGFYQSLTVKNAPTGLGAASLLKLTAAPTFVLGRGYYARPELRFFVTYASWNDNAVKMATAAGAPIASGAFGTDKSGTTFGASVETWF